jgi:hypothetical protein
MSPPLDQGSFFGLDFLQPVRLRSVSIDVGHTFQRALTVQVLHSLGDAWMTLQSSPHVTYLNSKKDSGSSEGSAAATKEAGGAFGSSARGVTLREE